MIKLLLTDVDGCLTDGKVIYNTNGDKLKIFNMQDGMAIKILKEHNILSGIISSDNSKATKKRAQDLEMDYIYINQKHKLETLISISKLANINLNEIAYIGDDIQDIPVLEKVGLSAAPKNAVTEVKNIVNYIADSEGGNGAFREIANYIVKLNEEEYK